MLLFDKEYESEEGFDLDAVEPDILEGPTSDPVVSVLCIIRFPKNREEARYQSRRCNDLDHEMYGIVLRTKPGSDVYTRIGLFELIKWDSELADANLQRWQESFETITITVV